MSPAGDAANNMNLTVPAIGVITGDGTVSPPIIGVQDEGSSGRDGDSFWGDGNEVRS